MPTAEAPPADAPRRQPLIREDYELDLRELFRRVLRHWRFIAACLVLALLGAVGFTLVQPRSYLAVSRVHIRRPPSQFTLDPRFVTNNDFELRPFYTHAKHPDVERAVQTRLVDELSAREQEPEALVERIVVRAAREDPALIELSFTDPDPRKASLVANAWAQAFVQHAQTDLNPSAVVQRQVEAQLREAQAELQRRDDAVRAFEQQSGLGLPLRDEGARLDLQTLTATVPVTSRLGSRGGEVGGKTQTLAKLREERDRARVVLAQTRALRSAGVDLTALGELRQLGVAPGLGSDQVVALLATRERALGETIDALAADVRQLEATLATDVAQLERLEREREIARDTYQTLAKKYEETKVATTAEWPVVTVFNRAPERAGTEPRPWPIILGVAAAAGLTVGLIGAFVLDARRARAARRAPRFDAFAEPTR